ncbi:[FeFe] hydrogenase H-cluster radical SAM maturase HydE [bacterium]|nr:[FeFe] hydrogenase H-cluster radical SAM maturase HydE [bacterium]
MKKSNILEWLKETKEQKLNELWSEANHVRKKNVGQDVHLRGLLEISNYCSRNCWYCGLRAERKDLTRYRMREDEILQCVEKLSKFKYGTIVIQSGEDQLITSRSIIRVISWIRANTDLAITLSLGEQSRETLKTWKQAGADRYLLRIETTNQKLLEKIHPGFPYGTRMDCIHRIKDIGYEVGSGIMIGIPGQTYEMLEKDIIWFQDMDLDMIGVGPYIPHPDTPLYNGEIIENNVIGSELMTNKVIALARILCPQANIPSTTALATINTQSGRETALSRGANVVMPNVTPVKYRQYYDIYPSKACIHETAEICHTCIKNRIIKTGRTIGTGKGSRNRKL